MHGSFGGKNHIRMNLRKSPERITNATVNIVYFVIGYMSRCLLDKSKQKSDYYINQTNKWLLQ